MQDLEAAATPKEEPRSSEASSSFPIAGHSHIEPVEDLIMAEEPRRVTLEDYSSSTMPQYCTARSSSSDNYLSSLFDIADSKQSLSWSTQ